MWKKCNKINSRYSEDFICDAMKIVSENNTFHSDSKFFLQLSGTAMGTKRAPNYAPNLVLRYFEELLYKSLKDEFGEEYSNYIEKNFLRYLDDCFIVWPHTKWDLNQFTERLNNLHHKLKFIEESDSSEIPFLDILVYRKGSSLYTDVFYKLTDTHAIRPPPVVKSHDN